jgi:S-adenosylmethionine:diacylglycerol 3-amino-3-carboxypropyl transferase
VRDNLTEEQIHNMVIYGNDKRLLQTSQFWLRDATVTSVLVDQEAKLNLNDLPRDNYFLFIGSLTATGEAEVIHKTEEYMVLKTPVEAVAD